MPEVSAVSVSPTWAVPEMVGWPVARLFTTCCRTAMPTGSAAALVSVSWLPASSVNDTRTLTATPSSASTRV